MMDSPIGRQWLMTYLNDMVLSPILNHDTCKYKSRENRILMYGVPGSGKTYTLKYIHNKVMEMYPDGSRSVFLNGYMSLVNLYGGSLPLESTFEEVKNKALKLLKEQQQKVENGKEQIKSATFLFIIDEIENILNNRLERSDASDYSKALLNQVIQLINTLPENVVFIGCGQYPWYYSNRGLQCFNQYLMVDILELKERVEYIKQTIQEESSFLTYTDEEIERLVVHLDTSQSDITSFFRSVTFKYVQQVVMSNLDQITDLDMAKQLIPPVSFDDIYNQVIGFRKSITLNDIQEYRSWNHN